MRVVVATVIGVVLGLFTGAALGFLLLEPAIGMSGLDEQGSMAAWFLMTMGVPLLCAVLGGIAGARSLNRSR